jgi:hypothetical protein
MSSTNGKQTPSPNLWHSQGGEFHLRKCFWLFRMRRTAGSEYNYQKTLDNELPNLFWLSYHLEEEEEDRKQKAERLV